MKPAAHDTLTAPYRVISAQMYNNLARLIDGLTIILMSHKNDNKQLDIFEYEWLQARLKAITDSWEESK